MNNHMYEHPATRANVQTLRERGVRIVEPGVGRLASKGEHGVGRLAEPAELLAACEAALLEGRASVGQACACSSRPAARASRSTACASSATAPRGAWGLHWPRPRRARGAQVTLVAANVALPRTAEIVRRRGDDRSGARAGLRARSSPPATCC